MVFSAELVFFFAPSQVGGQDPGQLVTKPFNTSAKMTTRAKTHAKHEYHLAAVAKSEGVHRQV